MREFARCRYGGLNAPFSQFPDVVATELPDAEHFDRSTWSWRAIGAVPNSMLQDVVSDSDARRALMDLMDGESPYALRIIPGFSVPTELDGREQEARRNFYEKHCEVGRARLAVCEHASWARPTRMLTHADVASIAAAAEAARNAPPSRRRSSRAPVARTTGAAAAGVLETDGA
eukprot:SAG11_NODE_5689_length_1486_cov_1.371305_1_plen_173_part_10